MVTLQEILKRLDQSKNETLLLAQSSLPQSQFEAFRKIFLNIFGKNGLEKNWQGYMPKIGNRIGTGRNRSCKKGGAMMRERTQQFTICDRF